MTTALSRDGGPAFGAHAFIWAAEWSREGAERVISGEAAAGLASGAYRNAGEALGLAPEPGRAVHPGETAREYEES